jgi:threonine synthase
VSDVSDTTYACIACRQPVTTFPHPGTCASCGGLIDVTYDLSRVEIRSSGGADSLTRWNALLPIPDDCAERFPQITLTPTPTHHARALGATVGLANLFVKNETVLPTGTTKDRIACVALPVMAAQGVRRFAMTSTGNSSTAFARLLPHIPSLEMCVFTPSSFLSRVGYVDACGDRVVHFALRDGSYSDALNAVRDFERRENLWSEGGFFNPSRREGLKLAFLEAVDQTETSFDWYVQAVSSAMGVYGCWKGAMELRALKRIDRLPKLLCVQEASCAPMVHSFGRGLTTLSPQDVVPHPNGVASAIMLGDPTRSYPYIAKIVRESAGAMMAVTEPEIRDAQRALHEHEGIEPCLSASAAIAGVLKAAREGTIASNARVLVNVSGGTKEHERSSSTKVRWLEHAAAGGDDWREV